MDKTSKYVRGETPLEVFFRGYFDVPNAKGLVKKVADYNSVTTASPLTNGQEILIPFSRGEEDTLGEIVHKVTPDEVKAGYNLANIVAKETRDMYKKFADANEYNVDNRVVETYRDAQQKNLPIKSYRGNKPTSYVYGFEAALKPKDSLAKDYDYVKVEAGSIQEAREEIKKQHTDREIVFVHPTQPWVLEEEAARYNPNARVSVEGKDGINDAPQKGHVNVGDIYVLPGVKVEKETPSSGATVGPTSYLKRNGADTKDVKVVALKVPNSNESALERTIVSNYLAHNSFKRYTNMYGSA